ncbi:hypothetical protein [Spirosoma sp. KNUC1025]|uniref:hypothetical protein n=1 Tax=Spirosoma sp. KNUC1025 TaxID=2894082 RepID=UPI003870407C|nr:hypothetical protein LN737_05080 [Spirosoma sp. KNUC1025]
METLYVLCTTFLGSLVTVIAFEIHSQKEQARGYAGKQHYEAMLWKQMEPYKTLLEQNRQLLSENIDLRRKQAQLERKYERMLAILN